MALPQEWPEALVPVQFLSDSSITAIPDRYVRPPSQRPSLDSAKQSSNIPVIDFDDSIHQGSQGQYGAVVQAVSDACKEWGFFQVVNHGVSTDVMERMKKVWREFFDLPMEEKNKLVNGPKTYQGYGNRNQAKKGAVLDWGDYFYLDFLPESIRRMDKWPTLPPSCREVIEEYGQEVAKLCDRILEILSVGLGLDGEFLKTRFRRAHKCQAGIRVNFYPKCPQPDLTYGLSPHSDLGGITALLVDEHVRGLQIRKGDAWFTVDPAPNAFIINIADQIQVISNGIYESVEHRAVVNSSAERLSIALFYNPDNDAIIGPAEKLVTPCSPALYTETKFGDYRNLAMTAGLKGKSLLQSIKIVN